MDTTATAQIAALRRMSVGELQARWIRLYGEPTRRRNRDYVWKRLAWRVQELQLGGLSDRAKSRINELADDAFTRARTPQQAIPGADPVAPVERTRARRDPRLPSPGTVISKVYKGTELRVVVRDDGYEYDGTMFASLTAVAKHVTGSKNINGKLFFGLTQRKRG
jgi:hypothetical protein